MAHRGLKIPQVDVLVHAGDISNMSNLNEMIDFNSWIRSLKEDGTIKQAIITVRQS